MPERSEFEKGILQAPELDGVRKVFKDTYSEKWEDEFLFTADGLLAIIQGGSSNLFKRMDDGDYVFEKLVTTPMVGLGLASHGNEQTVLSEIRFYLQEKSGDKI